VLYLPRAPDSEQAPFANVLRLGAACPQCVINTVRCDDRGVRQRIVVGHGLAEIREQFRPALGARIVSTDAVKRGRNHVYLPVT
jgi:hypothetical protein